MARPTISTRCIAYLALATPLGEHTPGTPRWSAMFRLPSGTVLNGYHLDSVRDYCRRRMTTCANDDCENRPAPHMDICEDCDWLQRDAERRRERTYWAHIDNEITRAKERRHGMED